MKSLMDHKHELLLSHAELDGEDTDLVMALLRTAALVDRACQAELAAFDLTEGRLSVMLAIASAADGSTTPAAIADQLSVTRAAVTGLLDGLERQGFIERANTPGDRRSTTVTLSPTGQAALETLRPVYGDWLRHIAGGISPDALADTRSALAAIQHRISSKHGGNELRDTRAPDDA